MTINTAEELGHVIKNGENTIEIEGDLAKKIIRIKATGNVAWLVAIGAIVVGGGAIYFTPATGGAGAPASGFVLAAGGATAVSILGVSATATVIAIATATGSVRELKKLYSDYNIIEKGRNRLVICKK